MTEPICTCIHEPEVDAGRVLHASYCPMTEPITDLATAVREQGALPMSGGPGPLSDEELAEIEDAFASCTANALAPAGIVLLAEINRLKADLATARAAALNEAADAFDRMAAAEPHQGYRAGVMRGAANDIRRLATTHPRTSEEA